MRNKIAKEIRKVVRTKYPKATEEFKKGLYKRMKKVWKNTSHNEKNNIIA